MFRRVCFCVAYVLLNWASELLLHEVVDCETFGSSPDAPPKPWRRLNLMSWRSQPHASLLVNGHLMASKLPLMAIRFYLVACNLVVKGN